MQTKLPIKQPPITAYQQIALPLTAAMLNNTADNWFYSNYIQVSCVNRDHYMSKGNKDNAVHYSFYYPELTYPQTADHVLLEGKEQLYLFRKLDFVKETIDAGWYVYTDADMFYIDGSDGCGAHHYGHDLMIYGYDDENNIFIYMYDESKLVSHTVSFDNFLKGYYSEYCAEDRYRNRAILFKPNDDEFEVSVGKIKWHMHDYLNGIETFARERPNTFSPDSLTMNGICTYAEFDKLFDYVIKGNDKFIRRSDMYCFYEHKRVMLDRVKYLNDRHIISAGSELIEEFDEICSAANTLMLLGLKVNMLKNHVPQQNEILVNMREHMRALKSKEESAWNRYISENREVLA